MLWQLEHYRTKTQWVEVVGGRGGVKVQLYGLRGQRPTVKIKIQSTQLKYCFC